jgi:hypothetical protein
MSLQRAKCKYQDAYDALWDLLHDTGGLDLLGDIGTYVDNLEETVSNLSDPEENPWD